MSNLLKKFNELPISSHDKPLVREFIEQLVSEITNKSFTLGSQIKPSDLKPGKKFKNSTPGSTEIVVLIQQKYGPNGKSGWLLGGLYGDSFDLYNNPIQSSEQMCKFLSDFYEPVN